LRKPVAAFLAGVASLLLSASAAGAQEAHACPKEAPAGTRCFTGRSAEGAYYWIAVPADWNGGLIVHAHGGPRTETPQPDDPVEDLTRFMVMVRAGYAWAGSAYRRGGYGVRMAAEDTDRLRQIFVARFGRPKLILLHGQSWGGNVAAKAAELYAVDADGARNYDGVLLTSGVIAGGTRAYRFRADLRPVYQYYCANHPAADEPQYPLWQGLPAGSRLTRKDLAARVEACTGVGKAAAERSPQQQRNLRDILAVTGIREDQLVAHLAWGTFLFRDMVQKRLGGRNPFDNSAVRYRGSHDDAALNRGVQRFRADPAAVAALAYDSDLSGLIVLPTLTLHAKGDPTASVSMEALYRQTVARVGRADLLVQVFSDEAEHSHLSDAEYAAALEALSRWVLDGRRPTPQGVSQLCAQDAGAIAGGCHIDPAFIPAGM
jgi:hypothetical protein